MPTEIDYKEFDRALIEEFLEYLNKISKIVMGGCPRVNVITEIFAIKKILEAKLKE